METSTCPEREGLCLTTGCSRHPTLLSRESVGVRVRVCVCVCVCVCTGRGGTVQSSREGPPVLSPLWTAVFAG